jgi:alpha-tubulin suppressor-like RCC1 family protein
MRRIAVALLVTVSVGCVWARSGAVGGAASTSVLMIAGGGRNTCAVLANGTVKCWGSNDAGQLGDGTLTPSSVPVGVENSSGTGLLTGAAQIVVGYRYTCAR